MKENIVLLNTLKEIPDVIRLILEKRKEISKEFVSLFQSKEIKKIYFSGQASGIYIGMMFKKFIEEIFKIEVQVVNPAAFLQNEKFNVNGVYKPEELCMICPAHSGSTVGPIEMAKICKDKDISVVCTTYNLNSELSKLSDVVIYKHSKEEESYIETKGHFASMICLWVCFLEYGLKSNIVNNKKYDTYIKQLESVCNKLPNILEDTNDWYKNNKELLLNKKYIRYIANGEYEGATLEGSLKIAETTHIASVYYETEEFMHRSTTQIYEDSAIVIVAPNDLGFKRNLDLGSWAEEYSNCVIYITSKNNNLNRKNVLEISASDYTYFSVIEYILVFEMLAYEMSEDLNHSVVVANNDGASKKLNTHI